MDYFRYFFDQQILEEIVQQSNLYAVQNNPNKPLLLTVMELEQFLGTVLYMACASLPNSRLHWSKVYHNDNVADVMSRDRWEEIKRNICTIITINHIKWKILLIHQKTFRNETPARM